MAPIKALLFDVFGTVVDWRRCVAGEIDAMAKKYGIEVDAAEIADAWRAEYQPAMEEIRADRRPFDILDILHRENLDRVLARFNLDHISIDDRDELNLAWHRLQGWPDSAEGLKALKRRFILATQSNGNIALIVNMAKGADLAWDVVLGAEVTGYYKPCPQAYDRACAALGLPNEACMMVAAHNDDLFAARQQGMRTAFVCRPAEHGPNQTKDLTPEADWDYVATSFIDLAAQLKC
jgi:2-haloacid dehalogenase